ncbi:cytochrome c oxidase assembly protein subunit 15 [Ancylobacter sp. 3268]|uniref:COX15/CtaA family protein n=1 Tax=Ancylobacter sp. 3268 TaxID=2817752 RepID=UPI00285DFC65|nr:COX15/CtaA family protein [Ancylobacter sp. 3268]MDR6953647.1 cytochrome c oxidase assembly protein subunit 15 [Ancylobacter sp. 3268]
MALSGIVDVSAAPVADRLRPVRLWLYVVAALIVLMVVVGGATRLTESGLSITEWKPVTGTLPPLSEAAWQAEFEKYRQIPQYQQINRGMSLDEFRTIFWWEWGHRLLGRLIGFVFLLPFLYFLWRGLVTGPLRWKLGGLFLLGGLQGAVGWWMVASGLVGRVDVSQYRLATHLTLACVILAATVAVADGLRPAEAGPATPARAVRFAVPLAWALLLAVLLQIFLGGLVAGLDAGLTHTTWPLMDGHFIPPAADLLVQQPAWRNLFENVLTVQFNHRMMAYTVLALAVVNWLTLRGSGPAAGRAALVAGLVAAQALLGILTLIHQVPIDIALAHQLGATLVLIAATLHLRRLQGTG